MSTRRWIGWAFVAVAALIGCVIFVNLSVLLLYILFGAVIIAATGTIALWNWAHNGKILYPFWKPDIPYEYNEEYRQLVLKHREYVRRKQLETLQRTKDELQG